MEQRMYGQGGADPQTGIEEPMWQLGLGGGMAAGVYPERPGEPDCMYYMRTGSCGYGERCRFNHPRNRAVVVGAARAGGEYPERLGQPLCQYFLKTGACKFGSTCKYHHPKQGESSRHVTLNSRGYPLRTGEKECAYYVKTGQCKFGVTCKFHHPQSTGVSAPPPPPTFYPAMQSPSVPSPQMYTAIPSWQVARPQLLPGSYVQGAYGPFVFSPVAPVSGWSPYPPPISPIVSPGGQHNAKASSLYSGLQQQLSASAPVYLSPYQPVSSSAGPSSSTQKEYSFPERPGQPVCQFYIRTGDCKFGPTCKYHHPPDWSIPKTNCTLSPIGLPLRPGAPPCTFYAQHGVCKFGPTCKFDHPTGMLSYSPSASSLADLPVAPYPLGFSVPTLAPSSSSSDLRPEYYASASSRDSFSARISLSGNTSSGSIGSVFSASRSAPHFIAQVSSQSTTHTSSSIGHGGEITGSR